MIPIMATRIHPPLPITCRQSLTLLQFCALEGNLLTSCQVANIAKTSQARKTYSKVSLSYDKQSVFVLLIKI